MEYILEHKVEEKITLLPCPFCGSDNLSVRYNPGSHGYTASSSYIFCNTCGAKSGEIKEYTGSLSKEERDHYEKKGLQLMAEGKLALIILAGGQVVYHLIFQCRQVDYLLIQLRGIMILDYHLVKQL